MSTSVTLTPPPVEWPTWTASRSPRYSTSRRQVVGVRVEVVTEPGLALAAGLALPPVLEVDLGAVLRCQPAHSSTPSQTRSDRLDEPFGDACSRDEAAADGTLRWSFRVTFGPGRCTGHRDAAAEAGGPGLQGCCRRHRDDGRVDPARPAHYHYRGAEGVELEDSLRGSLPIGFDTPCARSRAKMQRHIPGDAIQDSLRVFS